MRLSDAMRVGAAMNPQGFGEYAERDHWFYGLLPGKLHTCALGAAFRAVGFISRSGYKYSSEVLDEIVFPILTTKAECQVNSACRNHQLQNHWPDAADTMFGIVAHLNDDHLWTREQIADWVEQIERAEEAKEQCESENSTSLTED